MEPWVEAAALALGAESVTTVEYNKLTYEHPRITTTTPSNISANDFDVAFSISSFDHDGLGRYGDPLNPVGDLEAMDFARALLKPGGLLFLTVPVGPDVTVFNLHRRYGRVRLPLLLRGWEEVERLGWDEKRLDAAASWRKTYEPVFVLRRPENERQKVAEFPAEL